MYHSIFTFILVFLLSSCYALTESEYQLRFVQFMKQYNRTYTHDTFHIRYEIFRNNMDFIDKHNNKNISYYMKMNQYGDITQQEFAHIAHGYRPHTHTHPHRIKEIEPTMAPDHIDWRKIGYVSPIKNQLSCGSCWAFSSIASIETLVATYTGRMIPLSEQQLVDCSINANHGCEGGIMDNAFAYIIHHNGICSESDYPYIGADGVCLSDTCTSVSTISDYSDIPPMNETAMRMVVAKNPISVAIEADAVVFQFYGGGIIDDLQCGTKLNHGVTIIGYGFDDELDKNYWLVKNSWGTSWGENGYVRLIRDRNQCGIAQQASYPIY